MIRVFLADDHEIVRDGLQRIISEASDMQVVGEADNGRKAIDGVLNDEIDVLVLDIDMPEFSGLEVIERVLSVKKNMNIVAFSVYDENSYIVRILRAGAKGFVSKTKPTLDLLEAVRKVSQGGRYIPAEVAEYLFEHEIDLKKDPHQSLSKREYEVFLLLVEGKNSTQIAKKLTLSAGTIATYMFRIKKKLGVTNVGEIIKYGYRYNLVD